MSATRKSIWCAPGATGRYRTTGPSLQRWKHSELVLAGEVDDATAAMLLCPECDAELRDVTYDEGGGD